MSQADTKRPSGQEQHKIVQTVPFPIPYPQQFEDDTIDLYELCIRLWNWKWLVIAVTVVVALGSISYALQLQSIYKSEALLLKPNPKDFQSMNLRGIQSKVQKGGVKFTTDLKSVDIFKKFKQNLKSRSIQMKFIQEKGLMKFLASERTPETSVEDISDEFAMMTKLEEENGKTSFSIEMYDAEIASQWVNDLIEFVNKETISMLMEDLRNSIDNQIRQIEYNINSKRIMAERRRQDQIIRYTEHASIAKTLGMIGRDVRERIQNTKMGVDIATSTTPLYYLGYDALMTEIEILRDRKSDDPFIIGLRDLQETLALLKSINFDQEQMSAVHIDKAAYPPKEAFRPNRRIIVSIGTVAGLFSGIFLVFLIEFVKNQRKKHSD